MIDEIMRDARDALNGIMTIYGIPEIPIDHDIIARIGFYIRRKESIRLNLEKREKDLRVQKELEKREKERREGEKREREKQVSINRAHLTAPSWMRKTFDGRPVVLGGIAHRPILVNEKGELVSLIYDPIEQEVRREATPYDGRFRPTPLTGNDAVKNSPYRREDIRNLLLRYNPSLFLNPSTGESTGYKEPVDDSMILFHRKQET